MTIGERIAQIRKERGLSQEAFGESLGVTRQSISKWESNASIPDVDKLLRIYFLNMTFCSVKISLYILCRTQFFSSHNDCLPRI